ncbi:MAG TPA: LacI family DNA-binding transcriptional regulator [Opitutaceae bacterium]|nr:LacI family DNA-binding transcriptional regulator [Opitutaceae bacterium]
MNERRVTLADIAQICGVHVTTVSLALRNSPRLPAATRDRIHKTARRLGYRPDPWLRALVSYRRRVSSRRSVPTLAYVTNWNTRWGWKTVTAHPDFFNGASRAAEELGFHLEHFWMREPGLTHGRLSQILNARGIQGVIIASHVREIDQTLRLDWDRFSAVKIDYFPHQPELPNVTNNQLHIIRLAMQKVKEAGYKRIGFVMDEGWDITVDRLWSAGFLWEQQSLAPEDRIPPYLFPQNEPLHEWLEKHRPDVILSKSEFIQNAIKTLGWKVPRDVAFADIFLDDISGKTAGVRQNHETVGALAVEMLAGLLQHNKRGVPQIPTTTYVEGTWFDGRSLPNRNEPAPMVMEEAVLA